MIHVTNTLVIDSIKGSFSTLAEEIGFFGNISKILTFTALRSRL